MILKHATNGPLPFVEIDGDWSDVPVYVIGGGPSLLDFDFNKLKGMGILVGANRTAFVVPCDTMVTLDQHFTRMCHEEITHYVSTGGEAVIAMTPNERCIKPIKGAKYMCLRRNGGLSKDRRDLFGVNSGYAALGLAYLRKAREIALLGFDFKVNSKGKSHFHAGYSWHRSNNHRFLNQWATNFEKARQQLEEIGATVINFVGPEGSNVTAFKTAPLGDL